MHAMAFDPAGKRRTRLVFKVGRTEAPMRQPQHKRNARARNRRQPNPINRVYESNGPDVKVRGTAQHIAEKYMQLGRDALSGGDTIKAESYFQHAEHYLRIIAAAQEQIQQRRQQQQEAREQRMRGNGRSRPAADPAPAPVEETPAEQPVEQPVDPALAASVEDASVTMNGDGAMPEATVDLTAEAAPAAASADPANGNGGAGEMTFVLASTDSADMLATEETGPVAADPGNGIDSAWEGPQPSFLITPALPAESEPEPAAETEAGDGAGDEASAAETQASSAEAEAKDEAAEKTTTKRRRTRRTRTTTTRRTRKTATKSEDSGNEATDSPGS